MNCTNVSRANSGYSVNDFIPNLIGIIATVFGSFLFIPQTYKTIRTKNFAGLSTFTFVISLTSNVLWITYGVILQSPVLWLSVLASTICSLLILFCYLHSLHNSHKVKNATNIANVTDVADVTNVADVADVKEIKTTIINVGKYTL